MWKDATYFWFLPRIFLLSRIRYVNYSTFHHTNSYWFPSFLQKSPKKLGKEPPFIAFQYLETNWKPLVKKSVKYRPLIGRKRTYLGMGNQLGQYFFHFSLRIETDCNTINMIYRDRNFQFLVPGPGATLLGQHQSNHTAKVGIFFRF